jgi:hypothetical protein
MTEQEIIAYLKTNERAFAFIPRTCQLYLVGKPALVLAGSGWRNVESVSGELTDLVYRLRPDYEPESGWREYAITRDDQGYCIWTDAGDRWPLHVLESSPTPLGLFGGVQFDGCDTWSMLVAAYENDGGLHLFSPDHDSKLAVPVKCRFWEEK